MRILTIAMMVLTFGLIAEATDVYCDNAWSWGHDNPVAQEPKDLADPDALYPGWQKDLIKDEDGWWALKRTPDDYDYHYLMIKFTVDVTAIPGVLYCRWRVAVESGAEVDLYYWDDCNECWEYIVSNEGGYPPNGPDGVTVEDAEEYANYGTSLIFLAVGATGAGDNDTICDVFKLYY